MTDKILVTGAQGQLGSELNLLSSVLENHVFTFVSRNDLDISNEEAVGELLAWNKFTHVINCAAYTAVDKAESERDTAYIINGTAAGKLGKHCRLTGAKLIHISTDFIFDG